MKDILIVEDGQKERERLRSAFQAVGYSVVDAESVGDAENILQSHTFRLVILDIGLNDRSGSHLFDTIRKGGKASHVIIFTGNPSVHLKQRFLDSGAADYIVKGSPQAHNEAFLTRVREIIGEPHESVAEGIPLEDFLSKYVEARSKALFLNMDNTYPTCGKCGGTEYLVTFAEQAQIPPEIRGIAVCAGCGTPMDPEVK